MATTARQADQAIARAALNGSNVTYAIGDGNDFIRHVACLGCLNREWLQQNIEAAQVLDVESSALPCDFCGEAR